MLRPEPLATPSVSLSRMVGRPVCSTIARRDDADHAGVPVGRRQHDGRRQRLGQPVERLAQDDRLDLLALGVQRAEALRQRQRRGAVGRAEQLDDLRGVFEAPGGVQAGRQAKADGRGVDVVGPRLAHLEQRGQAGPRRAAQAADAHGRQAAVLVEQGTTSATVPSATTSR